MTANMWRSECGCPAFYPAPAIGHCRVAVANLILSLELVFTAVIAYFLLGENMNQLQLLGSALVMGGVLLLKSKTAEA